MKFIGSKILIIVFFTVLLLPNAVMLLGLEKHYPEVTNAKKLYFKNINIKNPIEALKGFKNTYNFNYGFKKIAFHYYNNFKENNVNENSLPEKKIKGKKGWYFLGNASLGVLNSSLGIEKFSHKTWEISTRNILRLEHFFKDKAIPFYVQVPRNKHVIYKENLPFIFLYPPKMDTLINFWKQKNKNVIDQKQVLVKAKDTVQVYHKTDSHWNAIGAFVGYTELIGAIAKDFPEVNIQKISQFKINYTNSNKQDLALLTNSSKGELIPELVLKDSEKNKQSKSKKYKVLIFHDSYIYAQYSWLKNSFKEVVLVKGLPDKRRILEEKPDLVIFELVERNLHLLANKVVY